MMHLSTAMLVMFSLGMFVFTYFTIRRRPAWREPIIQSALLGMIFVCIVMTYIEGPRLLRLVLLFVSVVSLIQRRLCMWKNQKSKSDSKNHIT